MSNIADIIAGLANDMRPADSAPPKRGTHVVELDLRLVGSITTIDAPLVPDVETEPAPAEPAPETK